MGVNNSIIFPGTFRKGEEKVRFFGKEEVKVRFGSAGALDSITITNQQVTNKHEKKFLAVIGFIWLPDDILLISI